ncbi:zf-TFIIB domain-containing protein [Alteromonas lipolytica]|uniref:Transcription factor zinc-finger domain-containing protein n=1 Tax=Alteromonas lipolytica TaxID=1856405 RepID=A0A1E8F9F9_9ALTE|nr:zf-TFIIB domain-containing protein [Alteromonas lipolytica]OFI32238.1 hypothetical protein BFC17_08455 [Alteromonas lipolytica]GGF82726.1 hypothetical protein GCM10011338_38770 [Alteromonas lipolytica]
MKCPKCEGRFEHIKTPFGVVERCDNCHGLWFDVMEHQEHKDFAEVIDTGDEAVGAVYNDQTDIVCPVCSTVKLLQMTDPKQAHIHFESCPQCHGRFYDAGEYQDFATMTLSDWLKRFGL